MKQFKCALCPAQITGENNTKEHIIPNAIGGRRKIQNFICVSCNNKTGETWDAQLAKVFAPFCTMFNIKKDRGEVPPLRVKTLGGAEYLQFADGTFQPLNPIFEVIKNNQPGLNIFIRARNVSEANSMLQGVRKKYKLSDESINPLKEQIKLKESYLEEPIQHSFEFDPEKSGRSAIKTALALTFSAGISSESCNLAIDYLINNGEPNFGYYNCAEDLVKNRQRGCPFHCVYIKAFQETGLILAYIEYFGFHRMIACMSNIYKGEDIDQLYAINPMTGEEIELEIELNLSESDISKIYNYEKYEPEYVKSSIGYIVEKAVSYSEEKELNRLILKAIEEAEKLHDPLKSHVENSVIKSKKFTELLMPYFINKMK
ncbi:HNH endonuclease [Acinetobacter pittii]|uniref:HNH endonuclease n=1 Tax=Acinetobacter pittii TaxID=48296 RepID=UPI002A0770B9|nr:HNH endonuclease [Acinetobacter pittii]MDX8164942.1 HNH endonuclease [Acinetobacter pittii]